MKNLKMGQFQIRHLKTINWKIKQKKNLENQHNKIKKQSIDPMFLRHEFPTERE